MSGTTTMCSCRCIPDNSVDRCHGRVDNMTNDQQRPKRGRPWAPLKGEDPQLRALAAWLRERCDEAGMTLREAEKRISYSRDTISKNLTGEALPEWPFVEALVTASARNDARAAAVLLQRARKRWEEAGAHRSTAPAEPVPATRERPKAIPPGDPEPSAVHRPSIHRRLAIAGTAALLVVLSLVAVMWLRFSVIAAGPPERPAVPMSTPASPHAGFGPLVPGDDSTFIADITIPDGSRVRTGQRFVKTWEIQNSGVIVWRNRYLTRQGPADGPGLCSSSTRTPIPLTHPGSRIRISVPMTAPARPGSCRVDWKMTDATGRHFFPDLAGLYLVVKVASEP
ncbi:NBR1-Ig-like domain-containing protein [Sphaerisporangium sp. B11E5]|uniref:NBR1-Ig-like domain-containing protein n=1 Tax=Sphaerisporangium sp. B11E5 TaxID=3153563 RepID=UPI00325F6B26